MFTSFAAPQRGGLGTRYSKAFYLIFLAAKKTLFVMIAATDHGHHVLIDLVDQPVLFGDAPGPAIR